MNLQLGGMGVSGLELSGARVAVAGYATLMMFRFAVI